MQGCVSSLIQLFGLRLGIFCVLLYCGLAQFRSEAWAGDGRGADGQGHYSGDGNADDSANAARYFIREALGICIKDVERRGDLGGGGEGLAGAGAGAVLRSAASVEVVSTKAERQP